jgi:hypothetical protein
MTTEFTNEHHEILFALFILQANKIFMPNLSDVDEEVVIQRTMFNYDLQWEDRAICEPEKEGYITKFGVGMLQTLIWATPSAGTCKITYRLEE